MYENLVKNVQHHLDKSGQHIFAFQKVGDSTFCYSESIPFPNVIIGAIETWLAQPKPVTPEERAKALCARYFPGHPDDCNCSLEKWIAEAIYADRATR